MLFFQMSINRTNQPRKLTYGFFYRDTIGQITMSSVSYSSPVHRTCHKKCTPIHSSDSHNIGGGHNTDTFLRGEIRGTIALHCTVLYIAIQCYKILYTTITFYYSSPFLYILQLYCFAQTSSSWEFILSHCTQCFVNFRIHVCI